MHTVVVVITNDSLYEQALAPFDQDLEVEAISVDRKEENMDFLKYHKEHNTEEFQLLLRDGLDTTDDETMYRSWMKIVEEREGVEFDAEGNEIEYSNPDTMWDFYVVGGRWEGQLIRKNDGTPVDLAEVRELDPTFGIMNMDTMPYVPEVLYEGVWYTDEENCRTILYGLRNMPNKHVAIIDYHI